jgi:hypothetical protein
VETAEQKAFLRDHACDEMQGFLFSKPLPPGQLAELLAPVPIAPSFQPAASAAPEKSASPSRLRRADA